MLLIFDLDGTLFQAKPVILQASELFCREMGVSIPDGGSPYKSTDTFLRTVLPDGSDITAARKLYDTILHGAVCRYGGLYPGVKETLETLIYAGHKLIIVSASGAEYIRLALETTGISELFDGFYSAEGFAAKSELIKTLIAPGTPAAVIGDTHGDIEAAQDAGLLSVAAMYGYGNRALLSGADYFADSPRDIARCIRQITDSDTR